MHPIIFKAGPLIIYSFSFFLALGLFFACFVVWKYGRDEHSEEKLFDSILFSFITSLFFARIVFTLSHFDFFGLDLLKWLLFFHYPGFSLWGGFLGLSIGLMLVTRSKALLLKFADLFSLGISFALIFGDLGCQLGGCTVGRAATLPWAIAMPGFLYTRHPLAIYFMVLDFLVMLIVIKTFFYLRERRKDLSDLRNGMTMLLYLSLFSIVRGVGEYYKELSLVVNKVHVVGVVLIFFGTVGMIIFYRKLGRSVKVDIRIFLSKAKHMLVSLATFVRSIFPRIYGKIVGVRKKESSIFLLNDSLVEEKLSKSRVTKENTDGQSVSK